MLCCHRRGTLSRSFCLKAIKVNDRLSIGAQPNPSDFRELRSLGFATVINNRPDGEEPTQQTANEASLEAEAAGLAYVRQPVTLGAITESEVRNFQHHIVRLNGPIFAHCKSGTRSLSLCRYGHWANFLMVGCGRPRSFRSENNLELTSKPPPSGRQATRARTARNNDGSDNDRSNGASRTANDRKPGPAIYYSNDDGRAIDRRLPGTVAGSLLSSSRLHPCLYQRIHQLFEGISQISGAWLRPSCAVGR